jgi:hypothetical protein
MLKHTYWSHNGTFQTAGDLLNKLIPEEGSVLQPRKNRALEKFRKASNAYYDLYNNGLCNRAQEFRTVFGISSSHYKTRWLRMSFMSDIYVDTERVMDDIVMAAAEEQGLAIAADFPRVKGVYA